MPRQGLVSVESKAIGSKVRRLRICGLKLDSAAEYDPGPGATVDVGSTNGSFRGRYQPSRSAVVPKHCRTDGQSHFSDASPRNLHIVCFDFDNDYSTAIDAPGPRSRVWRDAADLS